MAAGALSARAEPAEVAVPFALAERDVELWTADVHDPDWPLTELATLLSGDEIARADRFRAPKDRRDFVLGRGLLRWLLARYTGHDGVVLATNRWGKPALASANGARPLQFNVSHSGGLIALAFGQLETIGIDVEPIDERVEHLELALRFFAPPEWKALAVLAPGQLAQGFFNCWTRKEAFVKAHGMGLSLPLEKFEVSLRPGEEAELRWLDPAIGNARHWELRAFEPRPGYVGALALPRSSGALTERVLAPASLVVL